MMTDQEIISKGYEIMEKVPFNEQETWRVPFMDPTLSPLKWQEAAILNQGARVMKFRRIRTSSEDRWEFDSFE